MKTTITASDAKREFGHALLQAQKGPVCINKNGKPAAVMVSADTYAEMERMQRELLQQKIDAGIADVEAGRVSEGAETLEALRNQLRDANL